MAEEIFDTIEKQAEEILDFLKEKGYKNPAVRFDSLSTGDDALTLDISATIPRPQN
jgi:hypothetical protein